MLGIKRQAAHGAQRLVVEIGDAGVDLEIVDALQDFLRRGRGHAKAHARMFGAEGRRQRRDHAQRRGDDGNPHKPGQTALERPDLLPHRPQIADDPLGPFQHPLAFRRQAMETGAAIDEQHAERLFELLDAGGESWLGHAAGFGSAAEALLAGDGDEKFQLIDQGATLAKADRS